MIKDRSKKLLPKLTNEKPYIITEPYLATDPGHDFKDEQRKNPFWVPAQNTEVFNLKEMLSDKDKKSNKTSKKHTKQNFNQIQKEIDSKPTQMRRANTAKKIQNLEDKYNSAKAIFEKMRLDNEKQNKQPEEEYIQNLKEKIKMLNRMTVYVLLSQTRELLYFQNMN